MTETEKLARVCAAAAADKKAEEIVLLDMRGVSDFTDFFLICSANSEPQLKAISSSIREKAREECDARPLSAEGFPVSQWIVTDFGGLICHLFLESKREFYDLEGLWSDAKRIPLED
jgi:ribosome-associated protein